jgi:hypothetical protein
VIGALVLASSFRYPLGAGLPSRRWSAAAADYGLRQTHAFRLSSSPLPSCVSVCRCLCPSCQPANHPCLGLTPSHHPLPQKGPYYLGVYTLPSDPFANPGCGLLTITSCRRLGLIPPTAWQPAAHPACLTNPSQSSPPPSTLDKAQRFARAAKTARRSSDVLAENALQYDHHLPGTISRRPMSVHGAVIRCASRITSGYVRLTSQSRLRVRRNTI